MITQTRDLLVNNTAFRVAFTVGVLATIAGAILSIVFVASGDICVSMNYCNYSTDYYNTCIEGDSLYCCSYYKSNTYSCGNYYRSCRYEGYGYQDCTGMWIGRYVTGGVALLCLLIMICLAHQHKKRANAIWMGQYMRQN